VRRAIGRPDLPNLAWTYREPLPDVIQIAGLVAFYDDLVDVTVDGVLRERPSTAVREVSPRGIQLSARRQVDALPGGPGVYRFRDQSGRALYIGRSADLRRRVASYWGICGDRPRLRRMVARIERIEAAACDSEHEAAWLERNPPRAGQAAVEPRHRRPGDLCLHRTSPTT
jgi:hypothetical protein